MEAATQGPPTDQTNFGLLRLYFQNSFFKYFESIKGKKTVYFDEGLLKVLSFVFGTIPPQANIDQTLPLQDKNQLQPECDKVIFVVRPELDVIRSLIYQQKGWKNDKEFYVLYVPRRTIECDEELEKEKLFSEERVSHIAMDLIPLEEDLLSLEMADNFAHYMLGDDDNYKVYVQTSINRLETVFGQIKYKFAKGDDACQILSRINQSALPIDQSSQQNDSEIDAMIMIDRNVDLVTPFCVNQTYEGLLDEIFRIQTCSITVDTAIIKPDGQKDPKAAPLEPSKILTLTNDDKIFKDVRDKHFNTLESTFSQKVQQIQSIVKEKDAPQSIDELEAYITKLRNMDIAKGKDILTHHINLAFYINNQMKNIDYQHCYGLEQKIILGEDIKQIQTTIENKMIKQYSRDKILRLLCLLSVTQSGLKSDVFDALRKFYIMNYGYQEVITLMNLQDSKLLRVKDKRLDWPKLKKAFKLINEETRIQDPTDISYVYNGYSPLSIKLIETIFQSGGFAKTEEKLKILPGQHIYPPNEQEFFLTRAQPSSVLPGGLDQQAQRKKRVLIYFIGGITYGEIAAIRFLNKLFKDKKFIIATTQIINGETCIQMLRGKISNNLNLQSLLKK
eukprot:403374767